MSKHRSLLSLGLAALALSLGACAAHPTNFWGSTATAPSGNAFWGYSKADAAPTAEPAFWGYAAMPGAQIGPTFWGYAPDRGAPVASPSAPVAAQR